MSRVKGGTVTHARHKKIVDQAKGYYGRRKEYFQGSCASSGQSQSVRDP